VEKTGETYNLTHNLNCNLSNWFIDGLYVRNTKKKGAKNLNCALIGESGTGKSYAGIRICEQFYKNKLNKSFPVDNIVFTIAEFLERISDIDKCSCIIFDDAGLKYSSARWYDDLNQVLGYTLQSYRYKIINVFFTIPVKDWLDRIGRGMLHREIEMYCPGIGVYYKVKYSSKYRKLFYKRITILDFDYPDDDLINEYEEKKDYFLKKEYGSYLLMAKKYETDEKTNDHFIDMILKDVDKYSLNEKVNSSLVSEYLNLSQRRAKRILILMKSKKLI